MKHRLKDLLDIPRLQSALDSLYISSKIPAAIIDNDGIVHVASGWQNICAKFHRVHPEARKRCIESDRSAGRHLHEATPSITYKCPHGLVDSATPIFIEGEHIGNVFTGQLFFETPDLDSFRAQARAYGFDEEEYIAAVRKVPIIPEQAMQANRAFIVHLTEMLAEMGLKREREKEVRKRLRESGEIFARFLEHSPTYVFFKDENIRTLRLSKNYEEMLGMPVAEMIGKTMDDLFPSELAKRMVADDMKIMKEGKAITVEEEFNGRCYSTLKFPIFIEGKPRFLAGYTIDITERKRTEEALRASEERYRLLFQNTSFGFALHEILLDADGKPFDYRFLDVNPAFTTLTGLEAKDLIGRSVVEVMPGTEPHWIKTYGKVALTGESAEFENYSRELDRHYSVTAYSPKHGRFATIFHDVSERKRVEEEKRKLEQRVQQAQKLESLGVLAGGIAHDFNNLLMVILGHAELAQKEISPMSPARRSLTEITTATRRAAELCLQMLAYAGKATFTLERVELCALVEEMAHLLKTAISKKAILNLNLERSVPPIEADPSQIRQIVMNLLINASEAIGDRSGVITVSVGATRCDREYLQKTELHDDLVPGRYVHLEVTDTGSGMDAETKSRIFEPFFSTKFTGRGLGLAAVLGIVRAHKGALKVYSEPGKGTTFKVLFPASAEGEDVLRSPESSPLADWRGKGTILLVDDEESLIALGARMLEHLGFTVLTAADGLQAVDLYRERGKEIDLVLMDLTMPNMDGAEAFGELRRLNPDVRVILASGYSREDVAPRFAGKDLSGVLQKPYTLLKLRAVLAGLMPNRMDGQG